MKRAVIALAILAASCGGGHWPRPQRPTPPPPVVVVPPPVIVPPVVRLSPLVPADTRFVLEDGADVRLIGINSHQLRDRWQHDPAGYTAARDQALGLGFNVFRVFSMCFREKQSGSVWEPRFEDRFEPCGDALDDAYYASWRTLAADLAGHHAYLHVDVFACAQLVMADPAARQRHWSRMTEALRGLTNVLMTPGNELDNACNQVNPFDYPLALDILSGRGSNSGRRAPPRPAGQFEEYHSNLSPEPQREAHNAMEFNQGDAEGHIVPSRVPVILSEMPRPDQIGGLYKYYDNARASELLIAFSEYHCDRCRFSAPLAGDDLEGAMQHVAGVRSLPLWCKTAGAYRHGPEQIAIERAEGLLRFYQRGDDSACTAPIRP